MSPDELMDATLELGISAKARDRAMEKAHRDGLPACELCGRGIRNPARSMRFGETLVGPECSRRLAAEVTPA